MVKKDLIKAISGKTEATQKDVGVMLDAFQEVVKETLAKGDRIQLTGFGTFEVVERAAREVRNPQTGKTMTIQKSKAPKFKAGKDLKNAVNA